MNEPSTPPPTPRPRDERAALVERLEHCRREVLRVAARVPHDQATRRILDATDLTVAGIVRHLAWAEDLWFQTRLLGRPLPEPWTAKERSPDASMRLAADESLATAIERYREACGRSRAATAQIGDLDALAAVESFGAGPVNLRWVLTHLIAETARHLGHLDLLADRAEAVTAVTTATNRNDGRCIVAVHAHPDDESSKAAATISRYAAEGVHCILVCCTDGRRGRATNGDDRTLVDVRRSELDRAAAILGYADVHHLGFHDSGMPADDPDGFAHVPLQRITAELERILDIEQPDVIITYDPEYAARHPDHQHAHLATVAAFMSYGATVARPAVLYGTRTHSPRKLAAMDRWLTDRSMPSPYGGTAATPDPTTTRIAVGEHLEIARRALRQHASQVDPDDPWFYAVPTSALKDVHPYDDFTLLASTPEHRHLYGEDDLFANAQQ